MILSVREDEESIVNALDHGANDYLRKPFSLGELLARLRVMGRAASPPESSEPVLAFEHLEVNFASRKVVVNGAEVKLTVTEYELLKLLVKNGGRILTHGYILNEIWGPKASEHTQYLRVYIDHLRQKIELDPGRPTLILTEQGVGYRFTAALCQENPDLSSTKSLR